MKTTKLFSLVLLLLTIALVEAITIIPTEQSIEVFSSIAKNVFVNVTNNLNESIYFVTLESNNHDIQFVNNLFNLTAGESKEVKIVIDTKTSYNSEEQVEVFFYSKEVIALQPTTERVNITNIQFMPSSITIVQGSTIIFLNNDTIKHSVTSSLFDQDLNPGQEISYVFNNGGIFNYTDKYTNYKGEIIVRDTISSEYVHNPTTDTKFTLKIKSILVETTAELNFIEGQDFVVKIGETAEKIFVLKNTGNTSIALARFKANPLWLTFNRENLIVKAGEQSYIPFSIFPLITYSNETGKNYTVEILVQADNILPKFYNISVYIPFTENVNASDIFKQFNQTISEDFALMLYNTICKANPNYAVCQPKIVEKIVYKSPLLTFNLTAEEFVELRRRILENAANQERGYSQIQSQVMSIKDNAEQSSIKSTETLVLAQKLVNENYKTQNNVKNLFVFLLVVGIIVALALLLVGVYFVVKHITFAGKEFRT